MKINLQKQFKRRFKQVALCGLLGLGSFSAFAQQSTNLGSVKALKDLLANNAKNATARQQSANNLKFSTEQGNLEAQILNVISKKGSESYAGKILNHGWADFQVEFVNGKAKGFVILFDEKKAYEFTTNDAGNVELKEKSFDRTISIDNFNNPKVSNVVIANSSAGTPGTTGTGEQIPLLQSNTGASTVVYLDFDGETVTNPYWSNGETINAAKSESSASDIQTIFQIVAEDFAPFNVNVTTNRAIFDATPAGRRQLVIFTTTRSVAPNTGGVAYIGGFAFTQDLPCWVFNMNTTAKDYAEVASHEIGHTFGLRHDGRDFPDGTHEEYYTGHANWGPIVGEAYVKTVSQFSKGEYQYASNTEDDLNIIASTSNAFGFKIDDHANTTTSATVLSIVNNSFTKDGLISTPTDKDYFKFTSTGANATINIRGKYSSFSNLNVFAQILNANQQVIFESNSSNTLEGEFVNVNLPAGDYYIVVDGIGEGDASTGYTDYGSLGAYVISGTFVGGCTEPAWIAATAYNGGQKVSYNNRTYTAQWWSQNERPDLNTGSGKPWVDNGACAVSNPAPVVSLTSPANNTSVNQPATITISANASDDVSISKVEFYNGTTLLNTDVTAPYSYSWTGVTAGTYAIKAIAYDNLNASTSSSVANVTVINPAPTVALTSPTNNQVFATTPATIAIAANANDDGTISKVEFFNGTTLLNSDATAPYSYSWTGVAAGNYTITAKAYDNQNAITTSSAVTIQVGNQAPTVTLTSPTNGFSVNQVASISIAATANDADGTISKVEFYNGATLLNSDATAPFAFTWTGVVAGNYAIKAIAYDNLNATTTSSIANITVNNQAPSVTLNTPTNNQSFNPAPASVSITATAADADGTVSKVEFYNGTTLLNSDVTAPFAYTWSGVAAGTYAITAKAYDNQNKVTTSSVANITVVGAGGTCTAPVYNAATAYNGGQSVQYNGIKYTANWWTSGDRPDLNNGAVGTGKPWTSNGTCTARFGDATSFATGIYPNPSNGEFNIVVEENATAVILNAVGKEVTTLALVKGNNNVALSLATGVYFVNINNQVTKLVIE